MMGHGPGHISHADAFRQVLATNTMLRKMSRIEFTVGSVLKNVSELWHVGAASLQSPALARLRINNTFFFYTFARKRRVTYPELANARRCKLVVVGLEVGGRFGAEAIGFLRGLAKAKAREAPAQLRAAAQRAHFHRWTGLIAVAAQRALACSLLELPIAGADECDGDEPPLGDLLADARGTESVLPSRLPAP